MIHYSPFRRRITIRDLSMGLSDKGEIVGCKIEKYE